MILESVILHERAALYELLRQLYDYPLHRATTQSLLALEVDPDSPLATGLLTLQSHLKEEGTGEAAVEALNVEMTRLFEGPGQPAAPPYASYYLYGGQLMGPPAQAARQFYLAWQLEPAGAARLPDDHFLVELSFLAFLATEAAHAPDDDTTTRALASSYVFLERHVRPWLSRFVTAVCAASPNRFFDGLMRFTKQALEADLAWLASVLEDNHTVSGNERPAPELERSLL